MGDIEVFVVTGVEVVGYKTVFVRVYDRVTGAAEVISVITDSAET